MLVVSILVVIFFGAYRQHGTIPSQEKGFLQEQITTENTNIAEQQTLQNENIWSISLPKQEMTSNISLEKNTLIYATKEGYQVQVYKRNIQNGSQVKLFEYNESRKAEKSGNFWEELPPNISLSPNGKTLAFTDDKGLKTYDLQNGNIRTFIQRTEGAPIKWSVEELSAHFLARPRVSADGKYISFIQAHYEGSSYGVIDLMSGQYSLFRGGSGYGNLTWGPTGHSFVKPSSVEAEEYTRVGLHFTSANVEETENLSKKFGKEKSPFFEANLSSNGEQIVFTYKDDWASGNVKLGVVNINGSGFLTIDEDNIRLPLFSQSNIAILYIKKLEEKQYLLGHDLNNGKSSIIASLPEIFNYWNESSWTTDGYLAVTGRSRASSSELVVKGDSTRLVILDLQNRDVIYASPIYNQFITFAGFVN